LKGENNGPHTEVAAPLSRDVDFAKTQMKFFSFQKQCVVESAPEGLSRARFCKVFPSFCLEPGSQILERSLYYDRVVSTDGLFPVSSENGEPFWVSNYTYGTVIIKSVAVIPFSWLGGESNCPAP